MRKITVGVPEDVYTAARVYAARHNTSVSAIVADFLFSLRTLNRHKPSIRPSLAVDAHTQALRETPGRVHTEPRTTWDFLALGREMLAQESPSKPQANEK